MDERQHERDENRGHENEDGLRYVEDLFLRQNSIKSNAISKNILRFFLSFFRKKDIRAHIKSKLIVPNNLSFLVYIFLYF